MIKLLGYTITPTIFPDKTSQVWKLPAKLDIILCTRSDPITIEWEFENEAELIHVNQLADLLRIHYQLLVELYVPYLPYARQDKAVSNTSTFALLTVCNLLRGFYKVTAVDVHNPVMVCNCIPNIYVIDANKFFRPEEDVVLCYPDKGAADRYVDQFPNDYIILDKKRNQLTGEIEDYNF